MPWRFRTSDSKRLNSFLDHVVALANASLQSRPIKYGDVATAVADKAGVLQVPGGLRDASTAHPEHAGDQFVRHDQFIGRQADRGLATASGTVAAPMNGTDCIPQSGTSV